VVVERLPSIVAQAVPAQVPLTPVVGGALLALLITVVLWPVAGHLITATHEGGHALFGSAAGGAVDSVRVNPSQTGETIGIFRIAGAGRDLFWFGGYVTPSLFGVIGAILLDDGQVRPLLWLGLFFLFLLMLQVNDLFSLLVILAYGGLVVLVLRAESANVQRMFAYTWTWFLLFGGVRHILDLPGEGTGKSGSKRWVALDAQLLRNATSVPVLIWMGFWLLFSLAALAFGGAVMLGMIGQHAPK
jgi:hypothetical protein